MRTRPARTSALLLSATAMTAVTALTALTSGCARPEEGRPEPSADAARWQGKADQEDAMTSAEHALNAVEPESAVRVDEGMETTLARALERTFPTKGGRPHAFVVVCRSPAAGRSVTLTLERGEEGSDYEVTCGDREADRFEVPAGSPFTVRVVPDRRDADVMVLWRVETVGSDDVSDCGDDIEGCEA